MAWLIEFDPDALKELKKLDRPIQLRLLGFLRDRLAPLDDPWELARFNAFNSYLCSTVHVAHGRHRQFDRTLAVACGRHEHAAATEAHPRARRQALADGIAGGLAVALFFHGAGVPRGVAGVLGGGEGGGEFQFKGNDGAGGFLAGFDAGLVVGIDADERGVETDDAFVEGDQHAERARRDVGQGDGDGVTVLFGEGVAGAEVKALEEIAGGDAGFDLETWLASEIAMEFARAEGAAFVNGRSAPGEVTLPPENSMATRRADWRRAGAWTVPAPDCPSASPRPAPLRTGHWRRSCRGSFRAPRRPRSRSNSRRTATPG